KEDENYTERLDHFVNSLGWVTTAYINRSARSLVVNYYPIDLPILEVQRHLAIAIQRATELPPLPLSTVELAERLYVPFQALTWHRTQPDFFEWSSNHDPEGLAWSYDDDSKLFQPKGYGFGEKQRLLSKGQKVLHALETTAGGKLGAEVGRMVGGTLGWLSLGSGGMVVGAQAGTFLGETLGLELAALMLI
ncbi:MAG: hypothetical protein LH660_00705, partial [Phormidesmis sp. CAN_BIN36]|nr:hypothetical protein [Phormidesmis sp. CAN_BIN36]